MDWWHSNYCPWHRCRIQLLSGTSKLFHPDHISTSIYAEYIQYISPGFRFRAIEYVGEGINFLQQAWQVSFGPDCSKMWSWNCLEGCPFCAGLAFQQPLDSPDWTGTNTKTAPESPSHFDGLLFLHEGSNILQDLAIISGFLDHLSMVQL